MVRSFGVGEIKQSVQRSENEAATIARCGGWRRNRRCVSNPVNEKRTRVTTNGSRTAATADSGTSIISPLSRSCRRSWTEMTAADHPSRSAKLLALVARRAAVRWRPQQSDGRIGSACELSTGGECMPRPGCSSSRPSSGGLPDHGRILIPCNKGAPLCETLLMPSRRPHGANPGTKENSSAPSRPSRPKHV